MIMFSKANLNCVYLIVACKPIGDSSIFQQIKQNLYSSTNIIHTLTENQKNHYSEALKMLTIVCGLGCIL